MARSGRRSGPTPVLLRPADLGRAGELLVGRLLERAGYRILDRNWRNGRRELDIVALWGDEVVFVEVKTRRPGPQPPGEEMSRAQRRSVRRAASAWLRAHPGVGHTCRFDLIVVTIVSGGKPEVRHFKNAFEADHG